MRRTGGPEAAAAVDDGFSRVLGRRRGRRLRPPAPPDPNALNPSEDEIRALALYIKPFMEEEFRDRHRSCSRSLVGIPGLAASS
jgi:hypothetical protein